jgi:DNA-binding transcriptional MerR regulator
MTKVSITQASKMANISRQTMYRKYIATGIISVETENGIKTIDTSELLRVFGVLHDTGVSLQHCETLNIDSVDTVKDKLIKLLEEQLQEAKEEKKWLMQQLEKTTHLLENKQEPEKQKRKKILGIF